MAEHDDAVSPMGEESTRERARTGAGPIGRAWAWFGAQPMQTKAIIVGVIVVLAVVAYMAFSKKQSATTDQGDVSPGKFRPLGQSRYGPGGQPAPPTALPPPTETTNPNPPGSTNPSPPVVPPIGPTGMRPITGPQTTATASTAPTASPTTPAPVQQPVAQLPPATFPSTPLGMTPTMHRTDISLSGTITPLDDPNQSPSPTPSPVAKATSIVTIPFRRGPTPQTTRPTVISPIPTGRGTNIAF